MNIGILGATGAVGVQMLECLKERKVPVDILKNIPSTHSLAVLESKIPNRTPIGPISEKNIIKR